MISSPKLPRPQTKERTRTTDGWNRTRNLNPNVCFVSGRGGTQQQQNVVISSAGGASYHAVIGKQSVHSVDSLFDAKRWCASNTTHHRQKPESLEMGT
mmetsp:Transcript_1661/g.3219  ORF Transcript_1661/g.3219 Transcript_1661/m.3219 type:complete len:98 (-) Transcript_1661:348-641(-)